MASPLIGITTYNSKNAYGYPTSAAMHRYTQAIAQAGGLPILIPTCLERETIAGIFEKVDGILFKGGGDLSIDLFGGEENPKIKNVDPIRDQAEIYLASLAISSKKPFLGICRGLQTINVSLGGTLYTHIPDQKPDSIKHNYDSGTERELLAHDVKLLPGTRLVDLCGSSQIKVNSLHHQGVKDAAPGLTLAAIAPDGLVEGMELADHPFGVLVQWHPEWLLGFDHARNLFTGFVKACSENGC